MYAESKEYNALEWFQNELTATKKRSDWKVDTFDEAVHFSVIISWLPRSQLVNVDK
jgi:hypothetical protein